MSSQTPDYHDAELVLRLYELRRESVMRESRSALLRDFLPKSFEELKKIATEMDHPLNLPWRQVGSYFEMAFGFARHGIMNADLVAETCAEGLFLYGKVLPFLSQARAELSPTMFQSAEWLVANSKVAAQRFEFVQKRLAAMREKR